MAIYNENIKYARRETNRGDISLVDPNPFGYFYCNISSPKYMEHPLLQRKIKTSDGLLQRLDHFSRNGESDR